MARVLGSTPADSWERFVIAQLRQQLPADWSVIAGVSWSRRGPSTGYAYVRDGQADIVVLAPYHGMMILEVKGSRGFRIAEDGRWYRQGVYGEEAIDRPPPEQACENMHQLKDLVIQKGTWTRFPGLCAYAVVYPQGRMASPAPTNLDTTTIIQAAHMHQLHGRIVAAFEARGSLEVAKVFDAGVLVEVSQILTSQPFRIVKADTSVEIRNDIDGIETLTQQQFAALQGIFAFPRVAVTGPAGSGKTLLALWLLQALAEDGRRAMYVCFNKDLAAALRLKYPQLADSIDNVDRLFRRVVDEGGRWPSQHVIRKNPTRFFREHLPGLVLELVADWAASRRYDAVIIDEGQDFSDDQLVALLEMLPSNGGSYVYFADRRQDVYRQATSGSLGAEVYFTLKHNCRNTERINAHTNRLLPGHPVPSMPGVPKGIAPHVQHCRDAATMVEQAWKLASEWTVAGGVVVILSPFNIDKSCMSGSTKGYGLQLITDIGSFGAPKSVYFSTIKSFKGIEAASVIVVDVDVPHESSALREEDLYVACTRPTARLALLARTREAAAWMMGSDGGLVPG